MSVTGDRLGSSSEPQKIEQQKDKTTVHRPRTRLAAKKIAGRTASLSATEARRTSPMHEKERLVKKVVQNVKEKIKRENPEISARALSQVLVQVKKGIRHLSAKELESSLPRKGHGKSGSVAEVFKKLQLDIPEGALAPSRSPSPVPSSAPTTASGMTASSLPSRITRSSNLSSSSLRSVQAPRTVKNPLSLIESIRRDLEQDVAISSKRIEVCAEAIVAQVCASPQEGYKNLERLLMLPLSHEDVEALTGHLKRLISNPDTMLPPDAHHLHSILTLYDRILSATAHEEFEQPTSESGVGRVSNRDALRMAYHAIEEVQKSKKVDSVASKVLQRRVTHDARSMVIQPGRDSVVIIPRGKISKVAKGSYKEFYRGIEVPLSPVSSAGPKFVGVAISKTAPHGEYATSDDLKDLLQEAEMQGRFTGKKGIAQLHSVSQITREVAEGREVPKAVMCMELFDTSAENIQGCLKTRASKREFAIGLTEGLRSMHSENVAHCDLKPENVLVALSRKTEAVGVSIRKTGTEVTSSALGDLGMAGTGSMLRREAYGTEKYTSPERLAGTARDIRKEDMYAAGLTLQEIYTGKVPEMASRVDGHFDDHYDSKAKAFDSKPHKKFLKELEALSQKDVEERWAKLDAKKQAGRPFKEGEDIEYLYLSMQRFKPKDRVDAEGALALAKGMSK